MTVESRIAKRAANSGEASTKRRTSSKAAPQTTRAPRRRQRKFYIIEDAWAGDFPYRILNEDEVFADGTNMSSPPKEGRGFRRTIETPTFRFIGRRPERDFWRFTYYCFISDRMKSFLERFDPEAFEFLRCEVKLPDGTSCPDRWLCDVVRVIDAVDEEKSRDIMISADDRGQKFYQYGAGFFAFNEDAVGPHHVFLLKYSPSYFVGDEEFKLACKAAGMKGMFFFGGSKY